MTENTSKFLGGILGDISSRSAYSQIIFGVASGWVTGFVTMKVGKFAAFAVGGGIVLLEIANQEGYIKVDWSKVTNKISNLSDKVEVAVISDENNLVDKAERYVDRKLERLEHVLKSKSKNMRKWYSRMIGDDNGPKLNDLHLFLTAFIGGVALGIGTS